MRSRSYQRRLGGIGVLPYFVFAALACLCVTRQALPAAKDPVRAEGSPAWEPREIVLEAKEKTFELRPAKRVVLRGAVRVESDGIRLEAAGAVVNLETMDVYAEGPVRLRDETRGVSLTCERLTYNLRTHRGRAEKARLVVKLRREPGSEGRIHRGEVSTAVVEAEVITREGPGRFVAEDAVVTSCAFAEPHWRLSSRLVEVDLGEAIRASGNTLYLGRVPVLRLPSYRMDISEDARHLDVDLRGGVSGLWGDHFRLEIGFPVRTDPGAALGLDTWALALGWREQRGWETGLDMRWKGAAARGGVTGDVFFEDATSGRKDVERALIYRSGAATKLAAAPLTRTRGAYLASARGDPLLDAASAASVPLGEFTYAGEPRHYVKAAHYGTLPGGWEMEARLHAASDRDVREEYLERDAKTGLPAVTFLDLRRRTGGQLLSVYSSFHVDPFRTETEYLPEVRWTAPATSLGGGVRPLGRGVERIPKKAPR